MLSRAGAHVVLWEVTFHVLTHVRCDGALTFLEWKRGKRKERRGLTKRVMVKDGVATWEEAVRFHGTVQRHHDRGLKEKDLRIRVHKVRSSDEKRIGGTEIEIARFVHLTAKGEVEPYEQRVQVPIKLQEKGEKYTCTLAMTIRTQPPSGPVALHEIESTASTNVSHITTTEVSDTDEITSDPAPTRAAHLSAAEPAALPLATAPDPLPMPPITSLPRKQAPRTVTFPRDLPAPAEAPRDVSPTPPAGLQEAPQEAVLSTAVVDRNPLVPLRSATAVQGAASEPACPPRRAASPVSPSPATSPLTNGASQGKPRGTLQQEVQEKDEEIRRLRDQLRRQKRENEHRLLVESAVLLITPIFICGLPVTSLLVFEALRHWRSFEPSDPDSASPFRTITHSFLALAAIPGGQSAYYCLASTSVLFLLVQQEYALVDFDREEVNAVTEGVARQRQLLRSPLHRPTLSGSTRHSSNCTVPALSFQEDLQEVAMSIYKELVSTARERLPKTLIIETLFNVDFSLASNAISALKQEHPLEALLQVFDDAVKHFEANFVPLELRAQYFTQLFLDITSVAVTALLDVPKLCTVGHGVALKLKAAALERWAQRTDASGMKPYGNPPTLLREIANLLILTNKEQLLAPDTRRDICPSMGDDLLARLLENYTPDEYDAVGFPYAKVRALKYRADAGRTKAPRPDPSVIYPPSLWSSWLRRDFGRPADGKSRWLSLLMQDPKCIPKGLQDSTAFAFLYQ